MTTLGDFLFPTISTRRGAIERLRWWESRRLAYNAIVGATGLCTLVAVYLTALLPPGGHLPPFNPMVVLAYGLAANVCYTLGWAIETAARLVWRERTPELAPALFRQGLAFSVGLTALPTLVVTFGWIVRVVIHVVR